MKEKIERENRDVGGYAIKAEEYLLFLEVCLLQPSGVIAISTFIPIPPWLMTAPGLTARMPFTYKFTFTLTHTHRHTHTHTH